MGNWHEIRQLTPVLRDGVAIHILDGYESSVLAIVNEYRPYHFYTYVAPAGEEHCIINMDATKADLGQLRHPAFIIQSGGKMWCGYKAFRRHIESVASYLSDAAFLVGDEYGYIDEYRILDRKLEYRSTYWDDDYVISDYIREHYPEILGHEDGE